MLEHLGVIADGNRRWAKERGLPTIEGHRRGLDSIEQMVIGARDAGIKYITFYVFSTENWGRSKDEVSYIMKLAETRILKYAEKLKKNNSKMIILGSKKNVPPKLASAIEEAEKLTADCTGITVCFCFNYGGEQEIADAATIANEVDKEITPDTIIHDNALFQRLLAGKTYFHDHSVILEAIRILRLPHKRSYALFYWQ